MNKEEMKQWIDNASYADLLDKWRFAPAGSPFFRDEMGDYFSKVMAEKKAKLIPGEAVSISKMLG